MLESRFYKVAGLKAYNFIKETPTQMFSCKYCEMVKISFLYRTPLKVQLICRLLINGTFTTSKKNLMFLMISLASNVDQYQAIAYFR